MDFFENDCWRAPRKRARLPPQPPFRPSRVARRLSLSKIHITIAPRPLTPLISLTFFWRKPPQKSSYFHYKPAYARPTPNMSHPHHTPPETGTTFEGADPPNAAALMARLGWTDAAMVRVLLLRLPAVRSQHRLDRLECHLFGRVVTRGTFAQRDWLWRDLQRIHRIEPGPLVGLPRGQKSTIALPVGRAPQPRPRMLPVRPRSDPFPDT